MFQSKKLRVIFLNSVLFVCFLVAVLEVSSLRGNKESFLTFPLYISIYICNSYLFNYVLGDSLCWSDS